MSEKEIVIIVEKGLIENVVNLPEGWSYDVLDKDILNDWDENTVLERTRIKEKLRVLGLE